MGVASVEARLSSFRHADPFVRSHAVLRHAAVSVHISHIYCMRVGTHLRFVCSVVLAQGWYRQRAPLRDRFVWLYDNQQRSTRWRLSLLQG